MLPESIGLADRYHHHVFLVITMDDWMGYIWILRLISGSWIIMDDIHDQTISLYPLILWCISFIGKSISFASIIYGSLYFIFWLRHQCGFADIVLIFTCCMARSMIISSWINVIACMITLIMMVISKSKSKGKVSLPFAPSILIAYGLISLIQQFIQ